MTNFAVGSNFLFLMEIIDIVLIIGLLLGAVRGFMRGLVDQVAAVAALLIGVWAAVKFSAVVADWLATKFNFTTEYLPVIAFGLTFAAVVVGVHFVGKMVSELMDMAAMGLVNKLAGLLLGVLLLAFVESTLLSIVDRFRLISPATKERSALYGPVSVIAPAVFPYLHFDRLKEHLPQGNLIGNEDADDVCL